MTRILTSWLMILPLGFDFSPGFCLRPPMPDEELSSDSVSAADCFVVECYDFFDLQCSREERSAIKTKKKQIFIDS